MAAEAPALSVVLIAPAHYTSVSATLARLKAQTIRSQIVLVLATT